MDLRIKDMDNQYKNDWKPFFRQLLVCSGVWTSCFVQGMLVGAPTVFIPQIRKENNSTSIETISIEMASWLSSAFSFTAIPCVILLTVLSQVIGRKICFFIASVNTFIAFLVFYTSNSVLQILISELLQGLFCASQIIISVAIVTEFVSPNNRGLFLTFKSATFGWGVWTSNAIGTFCHWKKIGLVSILCSAYMITTVLIWPESPYWLASKGKYKEAAASHYWLKGCSEESEKELSDTINTQKEIRKKNEKKQTRKESIRDFFRTVASREFYKPLLLSNLTGTLMIFSGKLVITVYAIDILKKITANESTSYTAMLILDGITVLSMYVGSFLSKFMKRRTLLLGFSSIGAIFLFALSLYTYLIHLLIIKENNYVSICLLVFFSIAVSCGPYIMCLTIYGELIPIRSRNIAFCITGLFGKINVGVLLKTAPYLFKGLGIHGTFLFFGTCCSCLIIILYKYLPETKDKTLQEISDTILGVSNTVKVEDADKLMGDIDSKTVVSQR